MARKVNDPVGLLHDANAQDDVRMIQLVAQLGDYADGHYWRILERMRTESSLELPRNAAVVAHAIRTTIEKAEAVMEAGLALGLFVAKQDRFYSPSLTRRINRYEEICKKRAIAGRKGGRVKAKHLPSTCLASANDLVEQPQYNSLSLEREYKGGYGGMPEANAKQLLTFPPGIDPMEGTALWDGWCDRRREKLGKVYATVDDQNEILATFKSLPQLRAAIAESKHAGWARLFPSHFDTDGNEVCAKPKDHKGNAAERSASRRDLKQFKASKEDSQRIIELTQKRKQKAKNPVDD